MMFECGLDLLGEDIETGVITESVIEPATFQPRKVWARIFCYRLSRDGGFAGWYWAVAIATVPGIFPSGHFPNRTQSRKCDKRTRTHDQKKVNQFFLHTVFLQFLKLLQPLPIGIQERS